MRAVPLKAAAQYVRGLVVAASFVLLLSFTFCYLGTLFCAASPPTPNNSSESDGMKPQTTFLCTLAFNPLAAALCRPGSAHTCSID